MSNKMFIAALQEQQRQITDLRERTGQMQQELVVLEYKLSVANARGSMQPTQSALHLSVR